MPKAKEQSVEKDPFFDAENGRKQGREKTKEKSNEQEQEGKVRPQPYQICTRLCHSAQNRKRATERIDRENQALTKRLDSTKPSRGMGRREQLDDFARQAPYRGLPAPGPSNLTVPPETVHFKLMMNRRYSRVKLTGVLPGT